MNQSFYKTRHEQDDYGAGRYDVEALLRHPFVSRWCVRRKCRLRILDVGVGQGRFLKELVDGMKLRCCVTEKAWGFDLVQSQERHYFDSLRAPYEFIAGKAPEDLATMTMGYFDIVCCNHVLEHVFETEKLLCELHRITDPTEGFCVVSVPNCAYWPSRVAALWGCQPLGSEVGTDRIDYGFRPRLLKPMLDYAPSGHIRDFTPASLRDICEHCGWKVEGWWKQSFGLLARLSVHAARNMAVILTHAT